MSEGFVEGRGDSEQQAYLEIHFVIKLFLLLLLPFLAFLSLLPLLPLSTAAVVRQRRVDTIEQIPARVMLLRLARRKARQNQESIGVSLLHPL